MRIMYIDIVLKSKIWWNMLYYVLEIHIKRVIHTAHCQITGSLSGSQLKGDRPSFNFKQFYLWTEPSEIFPVGEKLSFKHILYVYMIFDVLPSFW